MAITSKRSAAELCARALQALLAAGLITFALRSSGLSVASHLPAAIALLVVAVLACLYAIKHLRSADLRYSPVALDRMYAALVLVVGAYFTYKMYDNWGCKRRELFKFKCGHVNNASVVFAAIYMLVTALAFFATSLKCFRDYAAAHVPPETEQAANADVV